MDNEDLNWGLVRRGLDLDGATFGVVLAKVGREAEEPRSGVLGSEGGQKDKEEGNKRDCEGEICPECKWICFWGTLV